MALPPHVHLPRLAAGVLMVVTGIISLVITLLDRGRDSPPFCSGKPFPEWFERGGLAAWLICQSGAGYYGWVGGIVGGVQPDGIGLLAGPGLVNLSASWRRFHLYWLLLSAASTTLGAFHEFRPRWRGAWPPAACPEYS